VRDVVMKPAVAGAYFNGVPPDQRLAMAADRHGLAGRAADKGALAFFPFQKRNVQWRALLSEREGIVGLDVETLEPPWTERSGSRAAQSFQDGLRVAANDARRPRHRLVPRFLWFRAYLAKPCQLADDGIAREPHPGVRKNLVRDLSPGELCSVVLLRGGNCFVCPDGLHRSTPITTIRLTVRVKTKAFRK